MASPLLQLEHISKIFNEGRGKEVVALEDINLKVDIGEFITILGPSGCGKSTLLRIISGLTFPSKGQCFYRGRIVDKPSLERGYVFQDPRLFPWLTVLENINLAGGNGEDLLKKMQLEEFRNALPHELSGGMARRVALARALLPEPNLLLLDEPLTNLDLSLQESLKGELHKIWLDGVTCILVTHNLDEALELGTRLILLTQRPGTIYKDVPIDLPFPRRFVPEELLELKQKILQWMEAQP